ncbi:MAG TPA: pseudouridine synthase [Flavipsychrobacter sp.]|nr:pseudouridine synthase [Flavipsychrobacter sp.]
MYRYYIFHKPFHVLSQFSKEGEKKTLADYFFALPKDVYPVGRLDFDSEGLLFLTNDKQLTHRMLEPKHKHERTYWVEVEGMINEEAIERLENGVTINANGKHHTTAVAKAKIFDKAPNVSERIPAIRFRKNVPTSWLALTLTEGKNRQVRKMTAGVGFPTLRLIRYSIGNVTIEELAAGTYKELSKKEAEKVLEMSRGR